MEFMKIINQEKENKNSAFLCLLDYDLMAKASSHRARMIPDKHNGTQTLIFPTGKNARNVCI